MKCERNLALIVTIVPKGWGDTVMCASRDAGAEGGTVMFARGCGIHEKKSILGIAIEPEKEVVLTLVSREIEERMLETVSKAAELDKPGRGMAFLVPVERAIGRVHFIEMLEEETEESHEEGTDRDS
ncbi:MAG: P-II family nitrogen regulator [Methanomassiliicoccales archaeon]